MIGAWSRVLTRGTAWGALLLLVGEPGCAEGGGCLDYMCWSGANMSGVLEAPKETKRVGAKLCSEQKCFEGDVDIDAQEMTCASDSSSGDSICFKRSSDAALEVEAWLSTADTGTMPAIPPDGERYTLLIVDRDSGEVLVDETREADYETTRRDNCHWCWSADMSL